MTGVGGAVGFADEDLGKLSPDHIHLKFGMSILKSGPAARMVWFKVFTADGAIIGRASERFSEGVLESVAGDSSGAGGGGGGIRDMMWLTSTVGYPEFISCFEGTT